MYHPMMGHDSLEYNGRYVRLHDSIIWMLRYFLLQEVHAAQPSDVDTDEETMSSLRSFLSRWEWAGPGVWMNIDFSTFVKDRPDRGDLVITVARRVIDRINQFGQVIPLPYLQEHLDSEMCYFAAAQPTAKLVAALGKLCEMLRD